MLAVHVLPGVWGLPSASPYCVKLLTWLRMADVAHDVIEEMSPTKPPRGKYPYVVFEDGAKMPDSQLIIDHLTRVHDVQLDAALTPDQRAASVMIQRTLEDHLYYAILYGRWILDEAWAVTGPAYFGTLPPVARSVVPVVARRGVRAQLHHQGTGRHEWRAILHEAKRDLEALAATLGDDPYFLGADPHGVDAIAFAWLDTLARAEVPAALHELAAQYPVLLRYCERMRERYWAT